MQTRAVARIGVLSALAFVLMLPFLEFSIPLLFPAFLKYDFSEVVVLVGALGMGTGAGLIVEVVKDLLKLASGTGSAGWVGMAANLVAGGTLVLVTGWLGRRLGLHRWDDPRANDAVTYWVRGTLAILAGSVAMAAVMVPANGMVFIPLYGVPAGAESWAMAVSFVPFNLFKGGLSGVLGLMLNRRVIPVVLARLERAA